MKLFPLRDVSKEQSSQRRCEMIDDPKTPERPVEEPNDWPDEVPPDKGDVDFPGGAPQNSRTRSERVPGLHIEHEKPPMAESLRGFSIGRLIYVMPGQV
jgi:hypothetical protein